MDVDCLSYLSAGICSWGFSLFSDLMSMEINPEKFLGFECICTGKIFNILVQRWYNAGKIETAIWGALHESYQEL